jgi:hypothetical protein
MRIAREMKRQKVVERIKREARRHYYASQANRDMDCGGSLADFIRSNDTEGHANSYLRCVNRLRRIDPTFPGRTEQDQP